ncbi:MAG: glycosyltransferase family 4 protein, partial [Nitrospinota bacterium]
VLVKRHEIPQHLVLAGLEGFETDTITALIGKLGIKERVTIFGYVANESLPELYTKADVFVFPSLYESFGIPAIEAMAAKTPVVVSNIPALTEIVGDAGILVAPDSHEAMAKAVYKILQDEDFKNSLIEAGYKRAQGFTWEKTAIETLKVYLSALPH